MVVGVPSATPRYARAAVLLHWLLAALIVTLLVSGWLMVDLPRNTDGRAFWFNFHKSLGILTAVVIVWLLVKRLRRAPPPLPSSMPKWERAAAELNHWLFYLSMIGITVVGYLGSSFSKYGPKLFGIPMPQLGWDDAAIRTPLFKLHAALALVFAALIAIHVLAALKHLFVDKDGVFQRMSLER